MKAINSMETTTKDKINHQYGDLGLVEKIKNTLQSAGKDLTSISLTDLGFMDEMHIGGRKATKRLARLADLTSGCSVLDVGSGIGGPVRILAAEFDCIVTGLDLTEEFCRVAEMLSAAVGLDSRVSFKQGDALDMPFPDESFDRVWTQHCSMNIPDKKRLYSEIRRVLRPKGRLAVYDAVAGPVQPIHFPVPWASDPSVSFLLPAEELRSTLKEVGFNENHWEDVTAGAVKFFQTTSPTVRSGPPLLHPQLAFKENLRELRANLRRNLEEDRIQVVEAILDR